MPKQALPAELQKEIDRHRMEFFHRMTGDERTWWSVQLFEKERKARCDEIRSRYPQHSDREVRLTEARIRLGEDLYSKAFPDGPVLPA
jgi:hypothetical protein